MIELEYETILNCIPFSVERVRLELATRNDHADYYRIEAPDWINVVAEDDQGRIILIKQARVGVGCSVLETPGGCVDPDDSSVETAAIRELEEETGYRCGSIKRLATINPNPAIMKNNLHIFYAENCLLNEQRKYFPDQDEAITVSLVPKATIKSLLLSGQINHALSAYSLSLYLLNTMP